MTGDNGLDYGYIMQRALRHAMADVLGVVAENGLPGDHHFYISFETGHPGVDIPDWLRERYPEEMTIVLQEWFADLTVTSDRFSVTLNFSDQAHTLVIPLAAVRTFVDPSVKFGLKFDPNESDEEEVDIPAAMDSKGTEDSDISAPQKSDGAEVVSLDQFRKT